MTLSELYYAVAQLGFEDSLDSDDRFLFAANRALLQVNALRPRTGAFTIHHAPLKNGVNLNTYKPVEKTEDLYFYAQNAKSYYFETCGKGICYLEVHDSESWKILKVITFDSNVFVPQRGFIKNGEDFVSGNVRLRFCGEYLYSIKSVAMYINIYSDKESDIPSFGQYEKYDISALVDDFLSLATPPIRDEYELYRINSGYDVENGRVILLPRKTPNGLYKVIYNRIPKSLPFDKIPSKADTVLIDLDEDLCALMPPLIASCIWLDDEPAKAQYYLSLYQEQAEFIRQRTLNAAPVSIKNNNGW